MKTFGNIIPLKFLLMMFLSSLCMNIQAQDKNKILLDSLQKQVSKKNGDTTEVRALNKLCLLLYRSELDSALNCARSALELSKKIKYQRGLSGSNLAIGICYRRQGKLKEALPYFKTAKIYAEECKITINRIYSLTETGLTHFDLGDYIQAEESFLEALKLAQESNDLPWQYSILNNMGMVNFTQKNYDKAAEYYKQVIDYMRITGDKKSLSSALNNMGNIFFTEMKYDEALKYFKESISIGEELNDKLNLAPRYSNVGAILINQKKYKEALVIFEKSLALTKEIGNLVSEANAWQNMATCNREAGNFDLAIEQCEKALKIARKIGAKEVEKDALHNLSLIHAAKGNDEKGLEYYKAHIVVKDSLANLAISGKIAELQIAYETSEKNKEISDLKAKEASAETNLEKRKKWLVGSVFGVLALLLLILFLILRHRTKVKQREAEFNQKKIELEQKALRAQMNPHFIFNSLNSIQRLYVEGKMETANDYMADFSDLMRKILDNSAKEKISLEEEINTLKLYLDLEKLRNPDIFEYFIRVDDDINQLSTFVPPLVLQPFVENAIWHGILPKKQKGKIEVVVNKNENELICIIEDNGIGMINKKDNTQEDSIGKKGKHESKGMQLTEQRLGTKIKTDDLNPGTRVTIIIPLN